MAETYTAYMPADDIDEDDLVIARHLSGPEAMKIAFGYDDRWETRLDDEEYGSFTHYTWRFYPKKKQTGHPWAEHLQATVVRTDHAEFDTMTGLNMIAAQFLRRQSMFWDGRVQLDADFDKRLERVAEKREVRRIDREIATKLVDALLADGYTITCDLKEDDPEFKRSADRNGILEHMWAVELSEIAVHKGKSRGWIRLVFDESGWDVIQDYTVGLEHIVDPICEPYLPENQPDAGEPDDGIRMLVLESPEDILRIGAMFK